MHALVRASMQSISVDSPSFFEGGNLCVANALECMLLWALRLAYVPPPPSPTTFIPLPKIIMLVSQGRRYGVNGLKAFPEPLASINVHKLICDELACFV